MITAQDIQNVVFSKTMGGYKTAEVDAFLDKCAATVQELTETGEENTRKMQVLAETVMDYRNQEDSIRTALISAQRMAETVQAEAKEKADAILAEAKEKAEAMMAEAGADADNARELVNQAIATEREELNRVRQEVFAFKTRLMGVYREHLTLIGVLEDEATATEPVEEQPQEKPAAQETVVESVVLPEKAVELDFSELELDDEEE